jgi:hypothetical protein
LSRWKVRPRRRLRRADSIKTGDVIKSALGGILFIDEAYALSSKDAANDFGHEAIETLLKSMEDHRNDFIVIVAAMKT